MSELLFVMTHYNIKLYARRGEGFPLLISIKRLVPISFSRFFCVYLLCSGFPSGHKENRTTVSEVDTNNQNKCETNAS